MGYSKKEMPELKLVGRAIKIKHSEMGPEAWGKYWMDFFKDKVQEKIPNKINNDLYGVYYNFEGEGEEMSYSFLIACRVETIEDLPEEMASHVLVPGNYAVFSDQGKISDVVPKLWKEAWSAQDLERRMAGDFEFYSEDVTDPDNAKVEVYIGIK